jgi:YbbR domain-containing protein
MTTKNDFMLAVLSVVIAVLLRLALAPAFQPNRIQEFEAKVVFENLDERLTLVDAPKTLTVVATGSAEFLSRLDQQQVTAKVDLSRARPGLKPYFVEVRTPPRSRIAVSPKFPRVRLMVDKVARRTTRVELETSGLPAPAYVYLGATIVPTHVDVVGPESVLPRVKLVRATLDLSKSRPKESFGLPLEALDGEGRPVPSVSTEPATVMVSPALAAAEASKRVLVNPDWKGRPPTGLRILDVRVEPGLVTVKGPSEDLARLSMVETEPIDLGGVSSDQTIKARLALPAGVSALESPEVSIVVRIAPERRGRAP